MQNPHETIEKDKLENLSLENQIRSLTVVTWNTAKYKE